MIAAVLLKFSRSPTSFSSLTFVSTNIIVSYILHNARAFYHSKNTEYSCQGILDIEGCDLLEAQMPYIFYFESTRFVFLLRVGAIPT